MEQPVVGRPVMPTDVGPLSFCLPRSCSPHLAKESALSILWLLFCWKRQITRWRDLWKFIARERAHLFRHRHRLATGSNFALGYERYSSRNLECHQWSSRDQTVDLRRKILASTNHAFVRYAILLWYATVHDYSWGDPEIVANVWNLLQIKELFSLIFAIVRIELVRKLARFSWECEKFCSFFQMFDTNSRRMYPPILFATCSQRSANFSIARLKNSAVFQAN